MGPRTFNHNFFITFFFFLKSLCVCENRATSGDEKILRLPSCVHKSKETSLFYTDTDDDDDEDEDDA